MFGAGFVLGALRVTLLVPRLGKRIAELGEMPLMFGVILVAARFVIRRFAVPPSMHARFGKGCSPWFCCSLPNLCLPWSCKNDHLRTMSPAVTGSPEAYIWRCWCFLPSCLSLSGKQIEPGTVTREPPNPSIHRTLRDEAAKRL